MWSESNAVHRGAVQGGVSCVNLHLREASPLYLAAAIMNEVGLRCLNPAYRGPAAILLFLPYHDPVVKRTRRQQVAELGVTPRHLPHRAIMAI